MLRLPSLLAFASTTLALTFTSPLSGSTVDLTSPLRVTWIPGPFDGPTFSLSIINTDADSAAAIQTLATDIRTFSGAYTVPANTLINYGNGFELVATNPNGEEIGSSGSFGLADGVYSLQTASNGVLTLVTSTTLQESTAPSSSTTPPTGGSAVTSAKSGKAPTKSASGTPSPRTSSSSSSVVVASSTAAAAASLTSGPTTSSAAATRSSSSSNSNSNSNSNLGFNSAAAVARASVLLSCAAVLGALALLA